MLQRTRIKICGLTGGEHVTAAIEAGADAVGFVLARSSPRYIDPASAADLICDLPPFVNAVGVFSNQSPDEIATCADEACIQSVQVHGRVSNASLAELHDQFTILRAVTFGCPGWKEWINHADVDLLVIDSASGGEGIEMDWKALAREIDVVSRQRVVLAGGLNAANVADAIRLIRPYAVDVSSGVESSRGVKDATLIRAFCEAVRRADEAEG